MGKNLLKHELEKFISKNVSWQGVVLAVLFALSLSWLADSLFFILTSALGSWLGNREMAENIIMLFLSMGILFFMYYKLRQLSEEYRYEDKTDINEIHFKKKRYVLLFLSAFKDFSKNSGTMDDIATADALFAETTNWHLTMYTIKMHSPKLKKVLVFVSKESAPQYARFESALKEKYPDLKLKKISTEITSLVKMKESFHKAFSEIAQAPENEIVIDITGGNKLYSVAASFFALSGHRTIQYVETTDETKRLRMFDNSVLKDDAQ